MVGVHLQAFFHVKVTVYWGNMLGDCTKEVTIIYTFHV